MYSSSRAGNRGGRPAGGLRGPFPSPAAAQASAGSAGLPTLGGQATRSRLPLSRSPPSPLPSCLSPNPLGSASSCFRLQLRLRASICLSPPSVCLSLPLPVTSPRKEGLAQAPPGFPAAASLGASPPLLVPGERSLLTSDATDCPHQFYGASVRAFRWTG